jgi:hypothetical protein
LRRFKPGRRPDSSAQGAHAEPPVPNYNMRAPKPPEARASPNNPAGE